MTDGSIIEAGYYQIAWLVDGTAAFGLLPACWHLVRRFKSSDVRWYLMSVLAVGMAVPSWENGDNAYWAPAILVGAFDFLDGIDKGLNVALEKALISLWPIAGFIAVASVLLLLKRIVRRVRA
mgnify:FL=1